MPNIGNLKKQAKQYLRWHREGYYPVAATIRATLPPFRDLGDDRLLQSSFRLADAQELVAPQEGFVRWEALLQGADAMNDTPKQPMSRPVFTALQAEIFVADVQRSCDFYAAKLGFTVEFVYGAPPFYAQVHRDRARLNLRWVAEPVFAGDIQEREQLHSASITVATSSEIKKRMRKSPFTHR